MSGSYSTINTKIDGPVAEVEINRPEALNALNEAVLDELTSFVDSLGEKTRVVLLTGSGEKAFVAGADIGAMQKMTTSEAKAFSKKGHNLMQKMETADQIFIACVDGFALGGGCELALACDIIQATEKAKFGQPEVHLGLIPGFGGTQRLARRIGFSQAMDMLLSGRHISGKQAEIQGLVSQAFDDRQAMMDDTKRMIRGILKGGPKAVAATKKAIRFQTLNNTSYIDGLAEEERVFSECFGNGEGAEGMSAFLEKRSASFSEG